MIAPPRLTLEAWVFLTSTSGSPAALVMKEAPGGLAYRLGTDAANRPAVSVNTPGGLQNAPHPSPLPLNTWTHVAGTYDGATLCVYVNGTQVASNPATGYIVTSTAPLRIGGNRISGEFVSGKIDGVRIYNRPLSPAEVQTDMNRASGASPAILLSALPQAFDEIASNGFRLYLAADKPATYAIEGTANFTTWQTVSVVQYTNGLLPINDLVSALPDRSLYRVQSAGGSLAISMSAPVPTVEQLATNGFRLFVATAAPAPMTIERTTDFSSWQPVGSVNYTNGPVEFTDVLVKVPPVRFYRARWR